jgi:hypothetical protein
VQGSAGGAFAKQQFREHCERYGLGVEDERWIDTRHKLAGDYWSLGHPVNDHESALFRKRTQATDALIKTLEPAAPKSCAAPPLSRAAEALYTLELNRISDFIGSATTKEQFLEGLQTLCMCLVTLERRVEHLRPQDMPARLAEAVYRAFLAINSHDTGADGPFSFSKDSKDTYTGSLLDAVHGQLLKLGGSFFHQISTEPPNIRRKVLEILLRISGPDYLSRPTGFAKARRVSLLVHLITDLAFNDSSEDLRLAKKDRKASVAALLESIKNLVSPGIVLPRRDTLSALIGGPFEGWNEILKIQRPGSDISGPYIPSQSAVPRESPEEIRKKTAEAIALRVDLLLVAQPGFSGREILDYVKKCASEAPQTLGSEPFHCPTNEELEAALNEATAKREVWSQRDALGGGHLEPHLPGDLVRLILSYLVPSFAEIGPRKPADVPLIFREAHQLS